MTKTKTAVKAVESGITKNEIITQLARSPHGKLEEYVPVVAKAAKQEPEFLAHLISWNRDKGQVRDSKVAIPVASLVEPAFDPEFVDNSLAHVAMLQPKYLLRAWKFVRQVRPAGRISSFDRMVERYLRAREAEKSLFNRTAVQHRGPMQELYRVCHLKPLTQYANTVLFGEKLGGSKGNRTPTKPPANSIFGKIATLGAMTDDEAAATILEYKIPFLMLSRPLGKRFKESPALMLA